MSETTAYFCLGSNIKPEQNIMFALDRIKQDFDNVLISNMYRSAAVGFDGDDFLNLAVAVDTGLSLSALLNYTDQLEQDAGRVRVRRGRFDSRTLDVDLVMYGDLVGEYEGRIWPSDDIDQHAYILLPLSEIAPSLVHPQIGATLGQLWNAFDQDSQPVELV